MNEIEQPTCEGCGRPLLSPRERFAAECSLCCFKRATKDAKAKHDTEDDAVEVPRRGMFLPGTLVQHYGSNDPAAMDAPDSSPVWEKIGLPKVATEDGSFDLSDNKKAFRFYRAVGVATPLPPEAFIHFDFGPRTIIKDAWTPLTWRWRLMVMWWIVKRRFHLWIGWRL